MEMALLFYPSFPPVLLATTMKTMRPSCLFAILLPAAVLGYQQPQPIQRREAFRQLLDGSLLALATAAVVSTTEPAHAVLGSKGCYQGQGEGCAELAGENSLIQSLQEKSAANRQRNEKVCRMADD